MTTSAITSEDQQHLNLLSIFHYILAGLLALVGCIPIVHLTIGIAMLAGAFDGGKNDPPPEMGIIFIVAAVLGMAFNWTLAICLFVAGRMLKARRSRTFCFIVAVVSCVFMPVGTVLGVFTIIVLSRPTVKQLFEASSQRSAFN